jgi:hypothetical protein
MNSRRASPENAEKKQKYFDERNIAYGHNYQNENSEIQQHPCQESDELPLVLLQPYMLLLHFLVLLELGTDSYTEVVPAPQGGRLW